MEEEYRWEKSEKCCCLSIQLQSHWQLQKLISKTYATIPRNLTNSATIAVQQKPAEGRAERGRRSAEKGVQRRECDRLSPSHDSTITALHAWLLTFELSRDCWTMMSDDLWQTNGATLEQQNLWAQLMARLGQNWLEKKSNCSPRLAQQMKRKWQFDLSLQLWRIYELWQHKLRSQFYMP